MPDSARCILGAKVDSLLDVRLPCFASFKLDGIRARWWHLEFMSRTFKTIANRNLRALAAEHLAGCTGWDGEIIVGDPTDPMCFRKTESFVNSRSKPIPPEGVRFFVFDHSLAPGGFADRIQQLGDRSPFCVVLNQVLLTEFEELVTFEEYAVNRRYEGIITRSPTGRYKNGRSTLREQLLLKVKRVEHHEARIVDFEELQRNFNEPTSDERGYTKRSSAQGGKVPGGTLGAIVGLWEDRKVRVGSGFTQAERDEIWSRREQYLGGAVRFKRLAATGGYDLPRSAIYEGIRLPGT